MDLICLGEPLLEFNAAEPAHLSQVSAFTVGYGGDTSNTAIAARRSGADAGYVTHIGDDAFGTALVELWEREGVATTGVRRMAGGRTGIYFISRDPANSSFTYYREGSPASRMRPEDLPVDLIRQARALYVSGISQAISPSACDAVFHAIHQAREAGALVAYDPNHRPALWGEERARAVIRRSVELADVVLPNLDEGRLFSGESTPTGVVEWFSARGPEIVVLKMGADGALLHHAGQTSHVPPAQVRPVDSTGAGDAFNGAFLAQLVAGADPQSAAEYAAVAAALTTEGPGAVEPIPHRADVLARLATDKASTTTES